VREGQARGRKNKLRKEEWDRGRKGEVRDV
jgi:hypothetical protein